MAVDVAQPRVGWKMNCSRSGARQTAYQIQVASSAVGLKQNAPDRWDSGKIDSPDSQQIVYSGSKLQSRDDCHWRVRIWDETGKPSQWSKIAYWGVALLEQDDWVSEWIGLDLKSENEDLEYELPPCPYLRNEFKISKPIKSARLYATSLGLNEIWINGSRVGDHMFAPGWTDYRKRLNYHTYDVSSLMRKGGNAVGATLSYGWYSGYIGYAVLVNHPRVKDFYGEGAALKAQIEIEFTDGSTQLVKSDSTWRASSGPIRKSDILMGETYDARRELGAWTKPRYDDQKWMPVECQSRKHGPLESYPSPPVRITQELPAISQHRAPNGSRIFDFGQNMAGVVRLSINGRRGQKITIRHGEMLHEDGALMTENLRKARATTEYICRGGKGGETWHPQFTYQGFRYIEVSGLMAEPDLDLVTALVIGNDTASAGGVKTNHAMINQLHRNIVWTQRANFLEVPTDCPQRDERLGWLGDAQIYINSASYNMDVAAFFTKWMRDVEDAQRRNGAFANFAPRPFYRPRYQYSPAWMEAGIICPFYIHRNYGDKRILERHYPAFEKLIGFHLEKVGKAMVYDDSAFREITPSQGWGDWLSLGPETPKHQVANIYFGHILDLMRKISGTLGRKSDVRRYEKLHRAFQDAFLKKYYDPVRGITGDTQTLYAMTIVLGVLPESLLPDLADRLVALIGETKGTMVTGFIGTRFLLPALSRIGRPDLAYKFLCNVDFPSWGYSVENGATSIWERWNSYSHTDGFFDPGMNSYSHYAFGAVCEWMFGSMAGIKPLKPGYEEVLLQPEIIADSEINTVSVHHDCPYGRIRSAWKLRNRQCTWKIEVPPNCRALVRLPASRRKFLHLNQSLMTWRRAKLGNEVDLVAYCEFELPAGRHVVEFEVEDKTSVSSEKTRSRVWGFRGECLPH